MHDDDDALDLRDVTADDRAVEALRRPRAVSPDSRAGGARPSDDVALALLLDLLADVSRDEVPAHGRPPLRTVVAPVHPVRLLRRGSALAAVTAGVLSLTGVAAASTLVPAGAPLHGLGSAVRSAAGAVRDAVAPDVVQSGGTPVSGASPTATPTVTTRTTAPAEVVRPAGTPSTGRPEERPVPGSTTAVDARSRAAAAQVARWLDEAARHLADGRVRQAAARLDQAQARLAEVRPADGAAALRDRLAALRARVEAAEPASGRTTARPSGSSGKQDDPGPEARQGAGPRRRLGQRDVRQRDVRQREVRQREVRQREVQRGESGKSGDGESDDGDRSGSGKRGSSGGSSS